MLAFFICNQMGRFQRPETSYKIPLEIPPGQDANDDRVLHTALVAGKEIEVHTSCEPQDKRRLTKRVPNMVG